jgi:hypothetical protein
MEAAAKRRLADEYDAAQERGEVAKAGDKQQSFQTETTSASLARTFTKHV